MNDFLKNYFKDRMRRKVETIEESKEVIFQDLMEVMEV
jgi:hypothetical protein